MSDLRAFHHLPATVVSIPGTNNYFFSKEIPVSSGTNSFSVEAKDTQNNIRSSTYQMQVPALQRSLEYDFNGNLVRKTEPPPVGSSISPGAQKFEWDALNRLTAWQEKDDPEQNSRRIEWGYDGFDRRIRATYKIWNAGGWAVQREEWFYYIGLRLVQKRVGGSMAERTDYYSVGERRTTPANTLDLAYTRDRLGSVREMVDSTQTVRGRYTYDPYGVRTKVFGLECDLGFTGHEYEPASRLHLATYRAYDAELGRWIGEDPIGLAGGLNLYGYVFGDPANGVDPLGLEWTDHMPDSLLQILGSRELYTFNQYMAGVTDNASLGLSKFLREYAWGENDYVDECDEGYQLGQIVGMVADVAALLKSGAATTVDDAICQLGCFTEGTPVATAEGEKPIESLRVGDRVLNTGTIAGEDTPTEVNAAEWCRLVLRMALPEQPGNAVEVETLRRKAWCQERGVEAGALMPLELEHLGLSGPARILSIERCPEIHPGEGRVVLSTFTHYNTDVYALRLEGCEKVLHPTGRHPLFSVTRGDWVAVNELAEGDLLQTRSGPKKINSLGRKPGMHRVYNLEVEGEHCYFVGQSGVLGHNAGSRPCLWKLTTEGADKVMNHGRFGTFYRSSSDGLWWAADNAGHGGSAFKVFRETGKGLEWFRDADQFGNFIIGKHKGATGQFIPWEELKGR